MWSCEQDMEDLMDGLAVVTPTQLADLDSLRACLCAVHVALNMLKVYGCCVGTHYVVVDVDRPDQAVLDRVRDLVRSVRAQLLLLPHSTGGRAHRIFAATSWLLPQKYIAFAREGDRVPQQRYVHLFKALRSAPGTRCVSTVRQTALEPADVLVNPSTYLFESTYARDVAAHWNDSP